MELTAFLEHLPVFKGQRKMLKGKRIRFLFFIPIKYSQKDSLRPFQICIPRQIIFSKKEATNLKLEHRIKIQKNLLFCTEQFGCCQVTSIQSDRALNQSKYFITYKDFQIIILLFMQIDYKNSNFFESDPARKKTRFLSSLLDLKLVLNGSRKEINEDDSKRKCIKNCPIKPTVNESQIFQNFTVVEKKKSLVDKTLITKSLGSHFIFSNLIKDKAMQQLLLDKFKLCRVNKGQYLMKQNDNASSFFILHQGQLSVEIDGKTKKRLQSGDGFGQLALMYSSPRSASIKANKTSFLWFIDRATFRKAISSLIEKNFHQTRKFIQQTQFFAYLTSSQKDKIASLAINQKFSKGQIICKQGELASSMYILKSGLLKAISSVGTSLKEGSYFGEYTMLEKNCKWRQTVVVQEQSEVIALGNEDIQNALGRGLPLIVIRNKAKECLNNAKQFNKLSPHYQDLALDCFKIRNVQALESISTSSILFLVLQGEYQVKVQGGKVTQGNSDDKKLYGSIVDTHVNDEITFKTNGKIAWTTPKQLLLAFKGSYEETVEKSSVILKTEIKHRDHISQLRVQCSKYSINDFKVLTKLGQGQFGTVFLVTDPSKTRFYALKCISKVETVKNKLEKHLTNQKLVMEEMNYYTPFCVNFIRSYKDDNFVYFLMEYINGLELFDVIRIIGILNSDQTRFYGAIMLEFLEKIHSKNIIYRDLKPENVMVSEDGYLKLIDMGTCKKLDSENKNGLTGSFIQKTFTIIGTPNYMAPQIISGKGYSSQVDLWSLGVVLYEFMAGYVPFGEQAEDPYQIYQQILKKPLTFPKYMKDQSAISFITQLMNKQPEMRLGGSYSSLKKHSFLSQIQWSALLEKKIKPAFQIPKAKLIEVDKLVGKAKNLNSQLPPATGKYLQRKDQNSKWDQVF